MRFLLIDVTSCPLGTDDLKRKQVERHGGRYRCPSSQPTATVRIRLPWVQMQGRRVGEICVTQRCHLCVHFHPHAQWRKAKSTFRFLSNRKCFPFSFFFIKFFFINKISCQFCPQSFFTAMAVRETTERKCLALGSQSRCLEHVSFFPLLEKSPSWIFQVCGSVPDAFPFPCFSQLFPNHQLHVVIADKGFFLHSLRHLLQFPKLNQI